MAEARQSEAWNHTAAILAWIGNCNPYRKSSRKFHPRDFHPFAARKDAKPKEKVGFDVLKQVFVDRRS